MTRIRVIYKKNGLMTFVNHMDLPVVFARAARRAGLFPELTEGFSPHPRISLASPLAIGVSGYAEPADFWFENWSHELFDEWNKMLPKGLELVKYAVIDDCFNLARRYNAALYSLKGDNILLDEKAETVLCDALKSSGFYFDSSYNSGVISLTIGELDRCSASFFVKTLKSAEIIDGWQDVKLERLAIGMWSADDSTFTPILS